MDDLDRRALLGVAGVASLTALASAAKAGAGPLTPPAGSVNSTGRTLDEVYNKIPAVGGSDGRTPISSASVTISTPGSYLLTAGITGGGNVLVISASDVTVDLNGFTVTATGTGSPAVQINGVRENITIRNGTVVGGSSGISASSAITDVLIEDVAVNNGKTAGINLGSVSSRGCTVRRCRVGGTGSTTVAADGNLGVTGIIVGGSSCRVEECSVSRLFYNGGGAVTFRGINVNAAAGVGNIVSRCTVSHDAAITGIGIAFAGAGVYRDNTVTNFSVDYSGGTNGGGNV